MSTTSSASVPVTTSATTTREVAYGRRLTDHYSEAIWRCSMEKNSIDGAFNVSSDMTDESLDEMLEKMGLERVEERSPLWRRLLCPLFGHEMVPLRRMNDGGLTEVGDICVICGREWRF